MTVLLLLGALGCVNHIGGPDELNDAEPTTVSDVVVSTVDGEHRLPSALVVRTRVMPASTSACAEQTVLTLAGTDDGVSVVMVVPDATGPLDPDGVSVTLTGGAQTADTGGQGARYLLGASDVSWTSAASFVLKGGELCSHQSAPGATCVPGEVHAEFLGSLPDPSCVFGEPDDQGRCAAEQGLPATCSVR